MQPTTRITWTVQNLTIHQVREEELYLRDGRGVPYYRYPIQKEANFEITGRVDWVGLGWSQEKVDGLIPFLNQKLREYEDGFQDRSGPTGPDAP